MGTSTLASLAELKMHIRSEHQEKSTKLRMKNLFDRRSRSSLSGTTPGSGSSSVIPGPEPAVDFSMSPSSEASASSFRRLIPDDITDDEEVTGSEDPISLEDLFDFDNDRWVNLYCECGKRQSDKELELCELLNRDAATDGDAEVDVDEMTGDILMA